MKSSGDAVHDVNPKRQSSSISVRVPFIEKFCYGLGDAGGTIVTSLIANFLTFYYTDIFGLAPAIVGVMFIMLRIVDAVSDPLIGVIADRTQTRWGKYRPYMFWTAFPLGISCILAFQSPHLGPDLKVVYAVVTYFVLALSYSFNNVPYCALITRITTDANEGVSSQAIRFALVAAASFAVSVGLPFMVKALGGADVALGYGRGVTILSTGAILMSLACFAFVREHVSSHDAAGEMPLKNAISNTLGNSQLRLTFVMTLLLVGIFNTKGGAALYFITYVLHGGATYQALFFGVATSGGFLGSIAAQYLARRFPIRDTYVAINLILALGHFAAFFASTGSQMLWLGLVALNCVILGCLLPLHFTIIQLADQYGEWKTGMRSSGMSFAFNMFFVKLAWAMAGLIVSLGLVLVSYRAGISAQTPTSLLGIKLLSTVAPGVLHLLLLATAARLALTRTLVAEMTAHLSS